MTKRVAGLSLAWILSLIGAAWCTTLFQSRATPEVLPVASENTPPAVNNDADREKIHQLRQRILELERRLATTNIVSEVAIDEAPKVEKKKRERPSMRERIKEMRKNNPTQFAEIQARMEQFRKMHEERETTREQFLASIDTTHMTDAQRAAHESLQTLRARQEDLREAMHNIDLSDDDRHVIGQEMRDVRRQLSDLYETERAYLLEEAARSIGYTDEDVTVFTETIQTIIENTDPTY